ncbi:Glutathione peroxidase [Trinorchestia longiramus]|nr:Glutathione peroxidase [Trinorchestia longiramus]
MNLLLQKFPGRLQVLCFPTNQFGYQENTTSEEMMMSLKHVRPGRGFVPLAHMFQKTEANGKGAHPLFQFLKTELPRSVDDSGVIMTDPKYVIWSPVRRDDLSWNFEKFLVDHKGIPFRRYSKSFPTIDIEKDIDLLIKRQDREEACQESR